MGSVQVREVTPGDYDGIRALEQRHEMVSLDRAPWDRLWSANPLCEPAPERFPRGWVLLAEDAVVGHFGSIPMAYELGGRPLAAVAAHAWVVDAPFRRHSLRLIQRFFAQEAPDLFLDTTAVALAGQIFGAYGAHPVPLPALDQVYYWVTGYRGFARSMLRRLRVPGAGALAAPAGLVLRVSEVLRGRARRFPRPSPDYALAGGFDERFDGFWQDLRQAHPERLLFVRDCRWLQWHFAEALARQQAYLVTWSPGGRLQGYAIFIERERRGMRRAFLADWQWLGADETAARGLLEAGLIAAADRGDDALEAKGLALPKQQLLAPLQPRQRALDASRYLYRASDAALGEALSSPEAWDPGLIDGDASLF